MPATTAYQEFAEAFGYQLGSVPTVLEFKGGTDIQDGSFAERAGFRQSGGRFAVRADAERPAVGLEIERAAGQQRALAGCECQRIQDGDLLHYADWVWNATYNVYSLPTENPEDGPRSYAVNPQDPVASPFGWHDVNGLPGPDFFDTRGNNADAVLDRNGDFLTTGNVPPGGRAIGRSESERSTFP